MRPPLLPSGVERPGEPERFKCKALRLAGADPRDFSGVCARRGCISTATEAGVPEAVIYLQSGHAQSTSARCYIKLTRPDLLYATWEAFGL